MRWVKMNWEEPVAAELIIESFAFFSYIVGIIGKKAKSYK